MNAEETFKKILYTGIGAAVLSKEKMEKWASEFGDKAKNSEETGRRFMEEFEEESKKAGSELKDNIKHYIHEALEKAGLATKAEVDELKTRIAELEAKLADSQSADQ